MSETEEFITEKDLPKSKPKRQPTEAQLLHLENIRKKAMEKKKEMRETTEKANKQKEIESGKLQKKLEKEQLAKKYEETIEKAKLEKIEVSLEPKPEPKPQTKPQTKPEPKPERPSALVLQEPEPKPKPDKPAHRSAEGKKIKKIVYKEVSDDDESVEEVIVKRKPKAQSVPPQIIPPVVPLSQPSFHELVYQSSLDKLKTKMADDRCRFILNSVMPSYI